MNITLNQIVRDFLALRGESPDLLPLLEEGEDSAVLTLSRQVAANIPMAAVDATVSVPASLQTDAERQTDNIFSALDCLLPAGRPGAYIPFPQFDGNTLSISRAAYPVMLSILNKTITP